MEIEMELQQRIEEEGYEISFHPPGDGSCFYRAAAFQLGFTEVRESCTILFLIIWKAISLTYVILRIGK